MDEAKFEAWLRNWLKKPPPSPDEPELAPLKWPKAMDTIVERKALLAKYRGLPDGSPKEEGLIQEDRCPETEEDRRKGSYAAYEDNVAVIAREDREFRLRVLRAERRIALAIPTRLEGDLTKAMGYAIGAIASLAAFVMAWRDKF